MHVGLISDTHNNQYTVQAALARFRNEQIQTILHAGDITNVPTLRLLDGFNAWIAKGNMDHNPALLSVAEELFGPKRMANSHTLELDGVTIALTHGDSWQRLHTLIRAGIYDYVIHGHTHAPNDETVGRTRVINPGALGNSRWRCATCAILNLETGQIDWVEL